MTKNFSQADPDRPAPLISRFLNLPFRGRPAWWRRGYTVAIIVLLSVGLHAWAVWQLPLDADEPVYMRAGQEYAQLIKAGDFQGVLNEGYNAEHPPLEKLLYSIPFLIDNDPASTNFALYFNRGISALFGVLQVLVLTLANPLAGFLLVFHSFTLKYTSEVYLEALPLLTSLAAILAMLKANEKPATRGNYWLWISAVALGITVASKYTYLMILFPLAFILIWKRTISFSKVLVFGLVSIGVFFLFDPYLWMDPLTRLREIIGYHAAYTQGIDVQSANYPWYQPVIWIASSVPWHPNVYFYLTLDEFIFWLGCIGAGVFIKSQPWLPVWFLTNLAILLAWPTKWPQYSLILTPALCLLAAMLVQEAFHWIEKKDDYYNFVEALLPKPPKVFWWIILVLVSVVVLGKVSYEWDKALSRRGWSLVQADTTPLPSNTVNDVIRSNAGEMVLATDQGVTIWRPAQGAPWGDASTVFTQQNSALVDNRIETVFQDSQGRYWFGSDSGLSLYDGSSWQSFHSADFGLPGQQVRAISEDAQGNLWVGTLQGLTRWDGRTWRAYTPENSALLDAAVFSVAPQTAEGHTWVWVGSGRGVVRLDPQDGTGTRWDFAPDLIGWSGVAQVLVDLQNRVWIATLGGGVGKLDGNAWTFYRPGNSPLSTANVDCLIETAPDTFWIGLAYSTGPGGQMMRFEQGAWRDYDVSNSGYEGGEPLAVALDPSGKLWIATALNGLQIFDFPNQ